MWEKISLSSDIQQEKKVLWHLPKAYSFDIMNIFFSLNIMWFCILWVLLQKYFIFAWDSLHTNSSCSPFQVIALRWLKKIPNDSSVPDSREKRKSFISLLVWETWAGASVSAIRFHCVSPTHRTYIGTPCKFGPNVKYWVYSSEKWNSWTAFLGIISPVESHLKSIYCALLKCESVQRKLTLFLGSSCCDLTVSPTNETLHLHCVGV